MASRDQQLDSRSARRRRANRERGSIAVEFGLAVPILVLILLGGLQFGRVFMTRHRLEDAVSYAARTAAVTNQTAQGAVVSMINDRMGNEINRCAPLNTSVATLPGSAGVPAAVEVTATCSLVPMFSAIPTIDEVRVVVAMPLQQ